MTFLVNPKPTVSPDVFCVQNLTDKDVDTVDRQLDLSEGERTLALTTHLPLGVPQIDWPGADTCRLVQRDYVTGYNHDVHMPLWSAFTVKKKVISYVIIMGL